jgi:hypothetical protein
LFNTCTINNTSICDFQTGNQHMKQCKLQRLQTIAFHRIPKSQETKLFSEIAVAILLIGIFLLPVSYNVQAATTATSTVQLSGFISKNTSLLYVDNAVWIADGNYGGTFSIDKQYVLGDQTKLTTCINTLKNNNIKYALIWVGTWNTVNIAAPFIDNPMLGTSPYPIRSNFPDICSQFRSAGIIPIAWVEDGSAVNSWGPNHGIPNLAPQYHQAYYTEIQRIMAMGFSGFSDDIEQWTGTHQNWLDYHNNQAIMLHSIGKLCMPALEFDMRQNTNMYLNVDYIINMFYGSTSLFEDPQGDYYWQENFGMYEGNHGSPASPVILGIRNYNDKNPLSWQLAQAQRCISTYGAPNLSGFSFWLYEYMASQNPTDWTDWNDFIVI